LSFILMKIVQLQKELHDFFPHLIKQIIHVMRFKTNIPELVITAMAVITFSCNQSQEKKENTEPNSTVSDSSTQPKKTNDKTVLVGDWTRTDAAYQIKITELLDDGNMKAGYFNPKSINVGNAMWAYADGVLKIYIELRDENYPGSNYKLSYIPGKDLLAGQYYQAVESVTYDVVFLRTK